MRVIYAFLISLFLGIQGTWGAEVAAAGLAPVIDGNLVAARKAALEEAKRSAVEQALGSYVESRTHVSDFALASDKIYTTVAGRIDRYEITLDEAQGDLYRVEILAVFQDAALLSETEALLQKYHWHKKPRLLISVSGSGAAAGGQAANQLRQSLERQFRRDGFDVFSERGSIGKNAGFQLEAEVFLNTSDTEYQGIELTSNQLSANASLTRVGSGQIIASTSYNGSRADANLAKALQHLNKEATRVIYRELNWQLSEEWLKYQSRGTDVVLELSGEKPGARVSAIKSELSAYLRGLSDVNVDSADGRSAVLTATYQGWPEQLYDELAATLERKPSLGLALDGISGNTLQLRIL